MMAHSFFKFRPIFFMLFLLLFSCEDNNINRTLDYAEGNMTDFPEATLDSLETINPSQIKLDKTKALYALLITQARDKNYKFEKDDSLISFAVDYFDNNFVKDNKKRMLSHFYNATINYYAKEYSKALFESIIALSLVNKEDYFYNGKIHELISDLYVSGYNLKTATEHRKICQYYYNKANKKLFAFYAASDLCRNLLNIDSITPAKRIIDSLYNIQDRDLISHRPIVDISNIYYCLTIYKIKQALNIFLRTKLYNKPDFILAHSSPIAYMFACNNMPDSANKYLEIEERVNPDFLRNSWYNKTKHELARQTGDYKRMYETYVAMDSLGNLNLQEALDRNVALQEAEFYYSEKQLAEKSKKNWIYVSLIAISGVIILFLLLLLYKKHSKLRQMAIEQELKEFVSNSESTIKRERKIWEEKEKVHYDNENRLKDELRSLDEQDKSIRNELNIAIEEKRKLLTESLETQLEPISRIANSYFKRNTTENERRKLNRELNKAIAKFNSEKNLTFIEKMVDSINEGIITKFKDEVPKLDTRDIRYVTFVLAGCSTNMIALLISTTPGHCRMIKKRLIEKVRKSGSEDTKLFLTIIFPDEIEN